MHVAQTQPLVPFGRSSSGAGALWSRRYRLMLAVCALAYIFMLIWCYRTLIAPSYDYMGLHFDSSSYEFLGLGVLAAVVPLAWMDTHPRRPSTMIYFLLYALLYVPACIVPLCSLEHNRGPFVRFIICMAVCFWLLQKIQNLPPVEMSRMRFKHADFPLLLLVAVLGVDALIIGHLGFRFEIHSLTSKILYDIRADFSNTVQRGSAWLGYVMPLQAKVLAPCAVIYGIVFKRTSLFAAGVFSQIVIFMHTGHKTILLSPLLLIGINSVAEMSRRKLLVLLLSGLTMVILVAGVWDIYLGNPRAPVATSLFVRRAILVPGQLSGYYFDFFSENPKALLGHSILSRFMDYPYDDPPPKIIMKAYYGFDGSANAGVWSDGYANFGFAGMFAATAILGLAMWAYNSASREVDVRISTLLLVMPGLALVNSAVLTVLLTHGLLASIVLVSMMPRESTSNAFGR
jgi:hypothetical protein